MESVYPIGACLWASSEVEDDEDNYDGQFDGADGDHERCVVKW